MANVQMTKVRMTTVQRIRVAINYLLHLYDMANSRPTASYMQSSFKRIFIGATFFLTTIFVAVIGYILAGWTTLDAIYMVVITIFGVGYGEVKPLETASLRVFTILVIIAGALSVAYMVAGFVQLLTEGEIRRVLRMRQMTQEIQNLSNHVIVCGYGRMGQMLSSQLHADQQKFIILERDTNRVNAAQEEGYLAYMGNATDETHLQTVGISRARALAIVLPDDAANVFISLTARELNPNLMIAARGILPSSEKKLRLAGADEVILPANIGALRMAHIINHPNAVNLLDQGDGRANLNELLAKIDIQVNELSVLANSALLGRDISEVERGSRGTFVIVALRRKSGDMMIHPSPHERLQEGDTVIIIGHQSDMPNFAQRHAAVAQLRYRGARVRR
ncbi:MAG: voltage-gated potassium channel [Phormidesmis priestleyi Ana]|uniref:Voltage-gated potassium channel n=1 Tax=Phormidesmis priestleyi Ana TaxID=1666911 RepID=A0A0P8DHN6_9CYAN|nr:MAG: voltage-gated potassium channel [Phormidesmis priestleyi Ana]